MVIEIKEPKIIKARDSIIKICPWFAIDTERIGLERVPIWCMKFDQKWSSFWWFIMKLGWKSVWFVIAGAFIPACLIFTIGWLIKYGFKVMLGMVVVGYDF